jgi:hemerythrin
VEVLIMSDFMPWDPIKMSVGVEGVDMQHRQLVTMLNNLYKEMEAGNGGSVYSDTLAGLLDYTEKHFAFEEALMVEHQYPDKKSHLLEHTMLIAEARKLEKKTQKASLELFMFLRMWLIEHILQTDKKLGSFLLSASAL